MKALTIAVTLISTFATGVVVDYFLFTPKQGHDKLAPTPSHWVSLPDSYRRAEACIRDSDGKVLGMSMVDYPNLEPNVWYATGGETGTEWGQFLTKNLAKREVERHLGGCPGITPIDKP